MPEIRLALGCALAALSLAGCNYALASPSGAAPEAWIDAPLNGSSLPLAPVEVVWHAAAAGGVALVEFGVNGSPVQSAPPENPGEVFVMGSQPWNPDQEGNYVLQVRAQDSGGVWSPPATALVAIQRERQTEQPPSPTVTPTPEQSPTITATPPITSTPTPLAQASIERVRISTDRVAYEGGGACAPMQVTITVHAADPAGVRAVVLFYRLRNTVSGETTDFYSRAMSPQEGDLYTTTINPAEDIISLVGFPGSGEAWLQIQAVLQNARGDSTTRTPVFSDITVAGC